MTLGDTANASNAGADEERLKQYKNLSKHEDMRRRRTECSVEIRKQKRDDMMMKRRNVAVDSSDDEDDKVSVGGNDTEQLDSKTPARQPVMSFEEIISVLTNQPTIEDMRRCFESIRRALSKSKSPPVDEAIEKGMLNALIQALSVEDDMVRFEAAWGLTNIVSGTSAQTLAAVQNGCTRPLISLIFSPNLQLAEQCLWAVANIAGDSAQLRDLVINSHGIEALMHLSSIIDQMEVSFVRTLAWSFSNMCRHKNPNAPMSVLRELAKGLRVLLQHQDKVVRQDACWAVSYLTDGPDEQIRLAVDSELIPLIMPMLAESETLTAPALRVLGNMATGNDELTQIVIDIGTLGHLFSLLQRSKSTTIIKECCWLISNIIAGTQYQIEYVLQAHLLPSIIQVLDSGDFKCQFEASWAVANLAQGGTPQQIGRLWTDGAIGPLCKALKQQHLDMLVNVLETIYTLLSTVSTIEPDELNQLREEIEENGGLDNLEALQEHESEKIYGLSYRIIHEFFNEDESDREIDPLEDSENIPNYQF